MFIHGKPIKFGSKVWMMCSSNSYPYNMQIYSGKQDGDNGPLGSRVIHKMLSVIEGNSKYEVYFDNFFTSYDLLNELKHLE
jgi:hypothetical protein